MNDNNFMLRKPINLAAEAVHKFSFHFCKSDKSFSPTFCLIYAASQPVNASQRRKNVMLAVTMDIQVIKPEPRLARSRIPEITCIAPCLLSGQIAIIICPGKEFWQKRPAAYLAYESVQIQPL